MTEPFKQILCYFCHKPAVDFILMKLGDEVVHICLCCDDMVDVEVEVTEVVEVVETDAGTVFTDVTETVVAVATDEGIEVVDQVDVVEAVLRQATRL